MIPLLNYVKCTLTHLGSMKFSSLEVSRHLALVRWTHLLVWLGQLLRGLHTALQTRRWLHLQICLIVEERPMCLVQYVLFARNQTRISSTALILKIMYWILYRSFQFRRSVYTQGIHSQSVPSSAFIGHPNSITKFMSRSPGGLSDGMDIEYVSLSLYVFGFWQPFVTEQDEFCLAFYVIFYRFYVIFI